MSFTFRYKNNFIKKYCTYFKDSWLEDPQFKPGLAENTNDCNSVKCERCHTLKILQIWVGEPCWVTWKVGNKETSTSLECLFKVAPAKSNATETAEKKQLILTVNNADLAKAKIYWVFHVVSNSLSANCNSEMNQLF